MPGGRPPFYDTPEEMQAAINEYFTLEGKKTISGLTLHLGFADRHQFYEYEKKPEFSYTIKKARSKITAYYEELSQGQYSSGPIFMLKNLGFTDKQEIDVTGRMVDMPTIKINGKELEIDIGDRSTGDPTDPGETAADPKADQ